MGANVLGCNGVVLLVGGGVSSIATRQWWLCYSQDQSTLSLEALIGIRIIYIYRNEYSYVFVSVYALCLKKNCIGLLKTIGLTMMGVGTGDAPAPGVDMIAGSQLPPFYTAWGHRHPLVHLEKFEATTEINWRQNDTTFNSGGSYIYNDQVCSDDRWHISGLCKCRPSPIRIA